MSTVKLPFALFLLTILSAAACGARSVVDDGGATISGSTGNPPDAGPDAMDAKDATQDALPDVQDAAPDAPPLCGEDAGVVPMYVISSGKLYTFDPPTAAFSLIGQLDCPGFPAALPQAMSMAVDHTGKVYLQDSKGAPWILNTSNASCEPLGWAPLPLPPVSGRYMSFAANVPGMGETLFEARYGNSAVAQLATIDVETGKRTIVGELPSPIGGVFPAGTSDGTLYALIVNSKDTDVHLTELDKTSASLLSDQIVPVKKVPFSYYPFSSFAAWGGVFYLFTYFDHLVVSEYRPATGELKELVTDSKGLGTVVVGTSVCAASPVTP